ncbi:hypothetical protein [Burkholderia sp. lig30]|uniref:hypothetical protein n=1 Tax=Burkholderia sp. lig30 TaxID=1192124 RepID=UPI0005725EDD|nr:hypothetical protein [Burkholderia sp. lig30]
MGDLAAQRIELHDAPARLGSARLGFGCGFGMFGTWPAGAKPRWPTACTKPQAIVRQMER